MTGVFTDVKATSSSMQSAAPAFHVKFVTVPGRHLPPFIFHGGLHHVKFLSVELTKALL